MLTFQIDLIQEPGTPTASVVTINSGMAKVLSCNVGKGAQKLGTILPLSYLALSKSVSYAGTWGPQRASI